jgi:nicotinamide-nucleotide amidase
MKNNAAIISVGNELLNGNTIDTNSNWLQQRLLTASVQVVYSCCITDDISEIKAAIESASQKAGIILITGGLGPTDDDITRNAIAEFLNVQLVHHPEVEEKIKKIFIRINRPMVDKNKIQAYLPAGTEVIDNPLGTAPGIFYSDRDKIIASMPGVPSEMKRMFDENILQKIENFAGKSQIFIKKLKLIGAGESNIAEKLGNLMERGRNPLINCTVDCGIITLHIIATADNKIVAEKLVNDDISRLSALFDDFIYSFDGESLAEVVGKKLLQHKKTIALAESCTGGLIAKQITDIPGSSGYFKCGWITYSNEAKISQLGVKKELIEQFGAVSSEVAQAMAAGAREKSGADFALAVTGIAGPTGGTEQKPLGLVFIAIASKKGIQTEKFLFGPRDRDFIRQRTYQNALNLLRLKLGI